MEKGYEELTSVLTPREEQVRYYRADLGWTLEDVSNLFNVTRERIRKIEAQALKKLRDEE